MSATRKYLVQVELKRYAYVLADGVTAEDAILEVNDAPNWRDFPVEYQEKGQTWLAVHAEALDD